MPIASKLLYFQRRPSSATPEPEPEPPDPRRRPCRDLRRRSSLSSHHKPGQELVPGNQRDAAKSAGSAGNITEHVGGVSSSARLNRSVSDHGRLPDAVQQARERLLQRLNSVDLSGRRRKTWPSETIWAESTRPADLGVSTSADSILGSLTSCFQPGVSTTACKVEESAGDPLGDAGKRAPVALLPKPVPELQQSARRGGAGEGEHAEPSAECSICLERCGDADGIIQLRCKHVFHSACLERWLRSRGDCPYCRASVLLTPD
ncbi:probable E3 ubiquitin-protein ligase RHY1A [Phragmites australis]|uniref:probable E3 ubiquitin-protein ligase RHY1A n=1 Tax=Phragmites australis TaxID=29695 RepID=UPI002D7916AD|nr:probable E3 ubiquitin-protein ligase RHY1A [Phragmites australis]